MAIKRIGSQSMMFPGQPRVKAWASIVGKKEGEGPLSHCFDQIMQDELMGQDTFEQGERELLSSAVNLCADKAKVSMEEVQLVTGGDLLNQIISASFAARMHQRPFLGLYGACSTMAESLLVASALVDGGYLDNAIATTCSHFATAERQYRAPLELGNQRTPTAQWTVTGAGAAMVAWDGSVKVTHATIGKVIDLGVVDNNNMGAAMAPAASDTLVTMLRDLGCTPVDFDLIITGDLGSVGYSLMCELSGREGVILDKGRYIDCGVEIFDDKQDAHAGGSGCGCSASVLCGWLLPRIAKGDIRRMIFMATGALHSPTSSLQGESIPGIAHAVVLEAV